MQNINNISTHKKWILRILVFNMLFSNLLSLEYAILHDDGLTDYANSISNIYNYEVNDNFKLETETYSKTYINNNYEGSTMTDKITNFINDLINNNSTLKYLLILGDENAFPPIYTSSDIPSDDFYTLENGVFNLPPQIAIGRIPSSIPDKINHFVEKLSNFLLNPTIGAWRNKALLIADDEYKNGVNQACEIKHTINSDILYDILNPHMNVKTMYAIEYNAETTANGLEHVELNSSIIDELNNGAALINYIGHGDEISLSAEKIIEIDNMAQIAIDNNKLALWVVGTCKFGKYDNSNCMAEELIVDEDASIGVISTVRSVSSNYNIGFLEYLFNEYVNHFSTNNIIRIGDIIKTAKNTSYNNNPSFYQGYLFHLFGDPALPIFSSKQGLNYNFPQNINIGEISTIDILEQDLGNLQIKFNDYESDTIYYGTPELGCDGELSYTITGETIFKNDFSENSCYSIPLDAMNCDECNLKMKVYYQNNNTYNGTSYISEEINLTSDLNNLILTDTTGPEIIFKNSDIELYNNSILPIKNNLTVNITDSSGINIYNGIGHNLRYWFNDELDSYTINSNDFIYNNTCSGSGYVNISIPDYYLGYNIINFEAWDNYNNRTLETINLNFSNKNSNNYIIQNFLNMPNPFKESTHFTFQTPDPSNLPINVNIKIFNLNGALIKTLKLENINKNFTTITWNGKDNSNKELPNGSYIVYVDILSYNGNYQELKHIITKVK